MWRSLYNFDRMTNKAAEMKRGIAMNAIRKPVAVLLALALAFAMMSALAEPAATYYSGYTYRVYAAPNSDAQVLGTIAQGTPVTPLGNTNDGWRQISYVSGGKTIKGWIYCNGFVMGERDAAWYAKYQPESGIRDASGYDMDTLFFQIITYENGRRVSSSGGVLSPVEMGGMYVYVTNQNGGMLYASWSTSSKALAAYGFGAALHAMRKTADEKMLYVSDIDGKTGYVPAADASGAIPMGTAIQTQAATRYAVASGATLFNQPGGYKSAQCRTYAGGTTITLLNNYNSEWVYAQVYNSKGFFRLSELTRENSSAELSGRTMYVKGGEGMQYAILYTFPGEEGRNMGLYMKGTPITAQGTEGVYTKVLVGGIIGYMQTSELTTSEEDPAADKQYAQVCLVGAVGAAALYKAPSNSSTYVYIPEGTKVYRLRTAGDNFVYVMANGMTGYMLQGALVSPTKNGEAALVIEVVDAKALHDAESAQNSAAGMVVATGNGGKLHLRKAPATSATSLGKFENGTHVTVSGITGEWAQVNVAGKTGYMMLQYLVSAMPGSENGHVSGSDVPATPSPTPVFDPYAAGSILYVKTGNDGKLNLRAKADASATTVNRYENGTQVTVIKNAGTWLYVSVGGRVGYMMKQYLSAQAPAMAATPTPTPDVTATPDTAATPTPVPEATLTPVPEGAATGSTLYVSTGNDGKLNLRSCASASAPAIGRYANGTPVTVLKDAGAWLRVRAGGRTGYMMLEYLSATAPSASSGQQTTLGDAEATPTPVPSAAQTMVVQTGNDERLHLRQRPRADAVSLGLFANGTVVTVRSTANDWANVTVNGQTGYMMLKFLVAN